MRYLTAVPIATVLVAFGQEAHAKGHTAPFPDDFDVPTCNYLGCLGELLDSFGDSLGDVKLDLYKENSMTKAKIAKKNIKDYGNAKVSTDRLLQAMKWIQVLGSRAENLDNEDGVDLSTTIGDKGTTCAHELLSDMIYGLLGTGFVSDEFLMDKPSTKLDMAMELATEGMYKKSVKKSINGILLILREAGERDLPLCLEDH